MNFQDLKLYRVILELRYKKGFLYWDKCGETLKAILTKYPEWQWESTSVELTILKNLRKYMEILFNIRNIRFIQNEVENLNYFKNVTTEIKSLIVEKLGIEEFFRAGNRFLYVFPLKNLEQGKEIIAKSQVIEIPDDKKAIFGDKSFKTNFIVTIESEQRHYRFELTTIERIEKPGSIKVDEKFNPKYGLRIDIDIGTINSVIANEFDCSKFIQENKKFLEHNLVKLLMSE